mmetsp:Transcript_11308/g.11369  ORF Transcript_11308/g.11369 Transcript_11308/m.11369 type:complete len:104 (-) Transcript_11308:253-564(-)|eukprot:CAMPEP_0202941560 /NCGR_PEP_ID=MMETSP1395-20130829/1698_1 /ASSEMBLY_ACC=CAM_ASM_000871 /TAXON_ID=5961 /ORGANISM="Blepharisma japonicum, Strain Stock R1072" /LENGTH=103 /DNA_ID=CAMNT_0049636895 /DNA_START=24 /DNA_END=335 /DNA_ORIENTATION=+
MAVSLARSANAGLVVRSSTKPSAVKPVSGRVASRVSVRKTAAPAPSTSSASRVATKAMEVAQIAGEAQFIAGTAFTMAAMTLVGLALGFVLLRVEALAEEGKL